jgi:alanine racemase
MSHLNIKLENIAYNYNLLKEKVSPNALCASVIKANAYGIGAKQAMKTLQQAGCKDFFVALLDEALDLHEISKDNLFMLHGIDNNKEAKVVHHHNIIPVLNDHHQISIYNDYAKILGKKLPAILHFDTGMGRLGLDLDDVQKIINNNFIDYKYIMSHLACADEPQHPHNQQQLQMLKKLRRFFPNSKVSFANSSGVFLGKDYHFDLVRPGCALYGINPTPGQPNPMKQVVTANARIVQRRILQKDQHIGYGSTHLAKKGNQILVAGYGYADGYPRSLSNFGKCYAQGQYLDIIGRVSMDLLIIDASAVPEQTFQSIKHVEIFGDNIKIDDLASQAKVIAYEILTGMGKRTLRNYL